MTSHKRSTEIRLNKKVDCYKRQLVKDVMDYGNKLTADQRSEIIDLINFRDVSLRRNRMQLERDIKSMRQEFIAHNKKNKIKTNPDLKILIQSRLLS